MKNVIYYGAGNIASCWGSLYISTIAHELGHALVAKCYGDSINMFSVGSGPSFSWKKRNTTFEFGLYPVEGYVRHDRRPDWQWLFFRKLSKKNKRINGFIAAAGPLAGAVASFEIIRRGVRRIECPQQNENSDYYAFGMFAGGMIAAHLDILNLYPGEKAKSDGYFIAEAFQTPAAKRQFYGRMVNAASFAFPLCYCIYLYKT